MLSENNDYKNIYELYKQKRKENVQILLDMYAKIEISNRLAIIL
jgi:hypothetical protein